MDTNKIEGEPGRGRLHRFLATLFSVQNIYLLYYLGIFVLGASVVVNLRQEWDRWSTAAQVGLLGGLTVAAFLAGSALQRRMPQRPWGLLLLRFGAAGLAGVWIWAVAPHTRNGVTQRLVALDPDAAGLVGGLALAGAWAALATAWRDRVIGCLVALGLGAAWICGLHRAGQQWGPAVATLPDLGLLFLLAGGAPERSVRGPLGYAGRGLTVGALLLPVTLLAAGWVQWPNHFPILALGLLGSWAGLRFAPAFAASLEARGLSAFTLALLVPAACYSYGGQVRPDDLVIYTGLSGLLLVGLSALPPRTREARFVPEEVAGWFLLLAGVTWCLHEWVNQACAGPAALGVLRSAAPAVLLAAILVYVRRKEGHGWLLSALLLLELLAGSSYCAGLRPAGEFTHWFMLLGAGMALLAEAPLRYGRRRAIPGLVQPMESLGDGTLGLAAVAFLLRAWFEYRAGSAHALATGVLLLVACALRPAADVRGWRTLFALPIGLVTALHALNVIGIDWSRMHWVLNALALLALPVARPGMGRTGRVAACCSAGSALAAVALALYGLANGKPSDPAAQAVILAGVAFACLSAAWGRFELAIPALVALMSGLRWEARLVELPEVRLPLFWSSFTLAALALSGWFGRAGRDREGWAYMASAWCATLCALAEAVRTPVGEWWGAQAGLGALAAAVLAAGWVTRALLAHDRAAATAGSLAVVLAATLCGHALGLGLAWPGAALAAVALVLACAPARTARALAGFGLALLAGGIALAVAGLVQGEATRECSLALWLGLVHGVLQARTGNAVALGRGLACGLIAYALTIYAPGLGAVAIGTHLGILALGAAGLRLALIRSAGRAAADLLDLLAGLFLVAGVMIVVTKCGLLPAPAGLGGAALVLALAAAGLQAGGRRDAARWAADLLTLALAGGAGMAVTALAASDSLDAGFVSLCWAAAVALVLGVAPSLAGRPSGRLAQVVGGLALAAVPLYLLRQDASVLGRGQIGLLAAAAGYLVAAAYTRGALFTVAGSAAALGAYGMYVLSGEWLPVEWYTLPLALVLLASVAFRLGQRVLAEIPGLRRSGSGPAGDGDESVTSGLGTWLGLALALAPSLVAAVARQGEPGHVIVTLAMGFVVIQIGFFGRLRAYVVSGTVAFAGAVVIHLGKELYWHWETVSMAGAYGLGALLVLVAAALDLAFNPARRPYRDRWFGWVGRLARRAQVLLGECR